MNMTTSIPTDGILAHTLECTVKWYDDAKGFGFLKSPLIDKDILLHKNILEAAGRTSIAEDVAMTITCEKTAHGYRAAKILEVSPLPQDALPATDIAEADVSDTFVPVRVKWFDRLKGYGFVNEFGCDKDIFVGREALVRSGMQIIETGQALSVRTSHVDNQMRVFSIGNWI